MTPEEVTQLRHNLYNATVVSLRKVHPDLMVMRVRPDSPRPVHKPGQYTTLGLGFWEPRIPGVRAEELAPGDEHKLAKRAYSISCSVIDDHHELLEIERTDWLEFYIVLVRESDKKQAPALTPRLFLLHEGDRLYLGEKITGHFTLDPVRPGDDVIFLATGTGEAPHNYLLWELLHRGHAGRILSACCVCYHRDLGYMNIQEELMCRYSNYTYLPLTTREAATVQRKVYIQDLITSGQLEEYLGHPLDLGHTHVYLCGNPKMIGAPVKDPHTGQRSYPQPTGVIEILEGRGFQLDQPQAKRTGNLHIEEYW